MVSNDRTPCSLLAGGTTASISSARGALGAVGGGLAWKALGAAGAAFGAVGALAGGAGAEDVAVDWIGLSSPMGFCSCAAGCSATGGAGLASGVGFGGCCGWLFAAVGATEKLKAGTDGGKCIDGDDARDPYLLAVVSARPLRYAGVSGGGSLRPSRDIVGEACERDGLRIEVSAPALSRIASLSGLMGSACEG